MKIGDVVRDVSKKTVEQVKDGKAKLMWFEGARLRKMWVLLTTLQDVLDESKAQ